MQNPQLDLAYNYAQFTHRNIFLTGKAGTGKTTFLKHLCQTTAKRMIVVAPTGVAAINAGGVTIHSFFQLAPGLFLPNGGLKDGKESKFKYGYSKAKVNILRSLDLLVIDEISMVRADLLDAIDDVLRRYQNRYLPFGGVQLLMIGDLQQLAPVTTDNEWEILKEHYPSPYFFSSIALRKTNYICIELNKIYRQADPTFIQVLNNVRENNLDAATLQVLNSRYKPTFNPDDRDGYITLTTHNYQAHDINVSKLKELPTPIRKFVAQVDGDFPESSYPTDKELVLKVGAQVMFCKNDPNTPKLYYNGKIGRVVAISDTEVTVSCEGEDGENLEIMVGVQEWTNAKYVTNETTGEISEEIAGTFRQIPLKTAWAITIHKSQGLTFERAIINAGKSFSHGQVYVALSRCRSLEGMVLSTPITSSAIMCDPVVLEYNHYTESNQPTVNDLMNDRRMFVAEVLCDIFDFVPILKRMLLIVRLGEEHLSRSFPRYVAHCKEISHAIDIELTQVGTTFQKQIMQLNTQANDFDQNAVLQDRVQKGISYYLRKTAEIMGDFIMEGLPDIENKAVLEQMGREFELLTADYNLKIAIFIACGKGFSLDRYWDAKAQATMQQQPGKGSKAKGEKKSKKVRKISVSYDDDIKHRDLYAKLRKWREEKATEFNWPATNIMHVKTIIGIANTLPTDEQGFMAIPGFGKKMLKAFGTELLQIIEQYKKKKGL